MKNNGSKLAGAHERAPVLAVKELAARWKLDPKTVREAIELGLIPTFRVGGGVYSFRFRLYWNWSKVGGGRQEVPDASPTKSAWALGVSKGRDASQWEERANLWNTCAQHQASGRRCREATCLPLAG